MSTDTDLIWEMNENKLVYVVNFFKELMDKINGQDKYNKDKTGNIRTKETGF